MRKERWKRCENCRWYMIEDAKRLDLGECHFEPPRVVGLLPDGRRLTALPVVVGERSFCHRFDPDPVLEN